jgi:hypothetical protein
MNRHGYPFVIQDGGNDSLGMVVPGKFFDVATTPALRLSPSNILGKSERSPLLARRGGAKRRGGGARRSQFPRLENLGEKQRHNAKGFAFNSDFRFPEFHLASTPTY